jgi:hypothetical protein
MTDKQTPQQDWLQLAFDTLALQTFTFSPFSDDSWVRGELSKALVTYGYSIGGRRGHSPYRVHLEGDGILQHTVFVHPHAYENALETLAVLQLAVCDLGAKIWEKAHPDATDPDSRGSVQKLGPRFATYRSKTTHPSIMAAVKRLPLLLPPFPAAGFCPPGLKQKSRLRLYTCRCNGPIGKARVASDVWVQDCTVCHHSYLLQLPKSKETP